MSLLESAASGERLAALRDLRDLLAKQLVDSESGRDVAALSARFQSVLAEIADIVGKTEKAGDPVDEIAARRSARGGATARTRSSSRIQG